MAAGWRWHSAGALVGSLQAARAALRLNPAEAMRPKPPVQGGAIVLERFPWFWERLSFGWRLVLRNVFRNRLRSAVGAFATAMGAGLLVCGFILASAIAYLIAFQFELVTHSDVDLTFKDEHGRAALAESRALPGVTFAEPKFDVSCTFIHGARRRRGAISGMLPNSRLTVPRDLEGRAIRVPPTGLAMSRKLAELLDVAAGDEIVVLPTRGLREELRVRVAELSDSYIGMAVYADIHFLSRLMGEELAVNGVQLEVSPEKTERLALYREVKQLPAVQAVNVRGDVIKNLEFIVETQRIFISLVVLFAGVIFFSSLLNSSLISLAERRREVATLRVLGYTEWQVGALFLRESLVINSIGTLLGLPLGYSLAWLLSKMYNTEMFRFPLVSPPGVWYGTVIMALVFALGAISSCRWPSIGSIGWTPRKRRNDARLAAITGAGGGAPYYNLHIQFSDRGDTTVMRLGILLAAAALVLVIAVAGYQSWSKGVTVEAAACHRGAIAEYVNEEGKTRLAETYLVTMPYDGRVEPIELIEGTTVSSGQVVAKINPLDIELNQQMAQTAVNRLKASIRENDDTSVELTTLQQTKSLSESVDRMTEAAAEASNRGRRSSTTLTGTWPVPSGC